MAMVSSESNVHEAGEPTMSEETIGSSVYTMTLASGPDAGGLPEGAR